MFSSEQEILQANREGKELGVEQERRRVRLAAATVQEKAAVDYPNLDTTSAAMLATGWNDGLAAVMKAIGVTK